MNLLEIIAHFGRWGRKFHTKCDFTLYMDKTQFNVTLINENKTNKELPPTPQRPPKQTWP